MALVPLDPDEEGLLRRVLGIRCQRARQKLGLSQRELARIMGRSPSWVREIETGQQYAPPYFIRALATAVGISAGWFYGEDWPDPAQFAREIVRAVAEKS